MTNVSIEFATTVCKLGIETKVWLCPSNPEWGIRGHGTENPQTAFWTILTPPEVEISIEENGIWIKAEEAHGTHWEPARAVGVTIPFELIHAIFEFRNAGIILH